MILTDLADAARGSGLRVVETPEWKTRGHGGGQCRCIGRCATPTPMAAVQSVILHHTAGPATGENPSLGVVINGRSNLAGPLAHLVLGRSGSVYVVAAGLCWHAGATFERWQDNQHAIGIEAEATGTAPWPAEQYNAYLRLVRALCAHYRVPYDRVRGHKEVAAPMGRKPDPNFPVDAFRVALTAHQEDDVTPQDIDAIAAKVVHQLVSNGFGDKVELLQIINGIERRLGDVQAEVAKLRTGKQ